MMKNKKMMKMMKQMKKLKMKKIQKMKSMKWMNKKFKINQVMKMKIKVRIINKTFRIYKKIRQKRNKLEKRQENKRKKIRL